MTKNFTQVPAAGPLNGSELIPGIQSGIDVNFDPADLAAPGNVRDAGNQNVAGVKTFSSAPVVPDNSWAIAKTAGLQALLTALGGQSFIANTYRTGSNTDAQALQAASDAATAAGGGIVVAYGAWSLNDPVTFLEAVDLIGYGSSQAYGATVFTATTADASIRFGTTAAHSGGVSGGFAVNGAGIATEPFYVGQAVGRSFVNIDVRNSAGTGFSLQGTANCEFHQCNTQSSATDGFRLDRASGNSFFRCEAGSSGTYNLDLMSASVTVIPGNASNYPQDNAFYKCFFEYHSATTVASVHQGAGGDNMLSDCTIATSSTPTTACLTLVKVEKAGTQLSFGLRLRDCILTHNFVAGGTVAIDVGDNTSVYCTGTTKITQSTLAVKQTTNGVAEFDRPVLTGVTTWKTGANDYLIRHRPDFNPMIACTSVSTVVGVHPIVDPVTGALEGYSPIYGSFA